MKIFSYDSKFSQIMIKFSYACYLNILWIICSLPIVTIGASTTALYDVLLRVARDEEPAVTSRFFKAFKENFRQATIIWLILLSVGLLLAGDAYILYHLYRSTSGTISVIWTLMLALIIVASIAYIIILIYVFPLVATVKNTNAAMLKFSFLIGIRYLFCTILVFAIHFAMGFVIIAVFTPLILFGEGLCAFLSSYLLVNVLMACSYDPTAEETKAEDSEETEEA